MPKESVKRNHVVQILRKRISEFKLKEDNTMRINGFSGTNTQTGTMGMTQGNDSVSKNIQNQIANAQQKSGTELIKGYLDGAKKPLFWNLH